MAEESACDESQREEGTEDVRKERICTKTDPQLCIGDRVRCAKKEGLQGTVKEIKEDSAAVSDPDEAGVVVGVLWDNGTFSYFTPENLEKL